MSNDVQQSTPANCFRPYDAIMFTDAYRLAVNNPSEADSLLAGLQANIAELRTSQRRVPTHWLAAEQGYLLAEKLRAALDDAGDGNVGDFINEFVGFVRLKPASHDPISVVVFDDPVGWLKEHNDDLFADSVCVISRAPAEPAGECRYDYTDNEAGITVTADLYDHVSALTMLCEKFNTSFFPGGLNCVEHLLDPAHWDAEIVDAFRQLLVHGDIIYG